MRKPDFITFTGLDERTDIERVRALSDEYPIEWGVLFSPKRQGNDPRYPSLGLIETFTKRRLSLAAHLCGAYAAAVMDGVILNEPNAFGGVITLEGFERAQVNHTSPDGPLIAAYFRQFFPSVTPITQHRTVEFPAISDICWLYDCSGGRGTSPEAWPVHPGHDRLVGLAGGLNPDNVADQIERMAMKGPYWIDMESGVRTDDWLDLDKCENICRTVYEN